MTRRPTAKTAAHILNFTPGQPRRRSPLDRTGSVCRFERITKKQTAATMPTLDQTLPPSAQVALAGLIDALRRNDQ